MATVTISGQKAYVCDWCGRGFIRRPNGYCTGRCSREASDAKMVKFLETFPATPPASEGTDTRKAE